MPFQNCNSNFETPRFAGHRRSRLRSRSYSPCKPKACIAAIGGIANNCIVCNSGQYIIFSEALSVVLIFVVIALILLTVVVLLIVLLVLVLLAVVALLVLILLVVVLLVLVLLILTAVIILIVHDNPPFWLYAVKFI